LPELIEGNPRISAYEGGCFPVGLAPFTHAQPQLRPLRYAAAAHEVNHQNDQGNHQQQMDQTASHVEAETQKPQNQDYYEYRPKHVCLLRSFVDLLVPASHLFAPPEAF
jgi:hypothetical protein